MSSEGFGGVGVVAFESRRADTTAQLIEKRGGRPISAPSMQEVPLSDHQDVFVFSDKLFAGEVDVLICNTGVGTRMLIETMETQHKRDDILKALSEVQIVARGPKPTRALKKNDLPITLKVPEPNTWREILDALDEHKDTVPVDGRQVAVQEYGQPNKKLVSELKNRNAHLLRVPIYRWALPDDREPLKNGIRALIEERARVAIFTSRTQVDHVIRMASQEGWEDDFRKSLERVMVASVGPVCSEGLTSHGITVDFEPDRPKLGILVRDTAQEVARMM